MNGSAKERGFGGSGETLPMLLLKASQRWGDRPVALRSKRRGIWQPYTWKESMDRTRAISDGLVCLGLAAGDGVLILADSSPEWLWCQLAVNSLGGVAIAVHPDTSAEGLTALARDCAMPIRLGIAQNQEQIDKILAAGQAFPLLKKIVYWQEKGLKRYREPRLMSLRELSGPGEDPAGQGPGAFERRLSSQSADDPALVLFTKQPDGSLQAAQVSHRTLLLAANRAIAAHPLYPSDEYVSVNPGWYFEQVLGFAVSLLVGLKLNFPESAETVPKDAREISATVLVYPPKLWLAIAHTIQGNMATGNRVVGALYRRCLSLEQRRIDRMVERHTSRSRGGVFHIVADLLLWRPLRDRHGLNGARLAWAAGDGLDPETARFFQSIGVDVKQIRGSTGTGVIFATTGEDADQEGR